ncbi:putative adhesin [Phytomonospora endophytica]|uniref:Putative adhesin Stv domain-containing protein n=1 Tax=Phytomonospora endophytica TaxID=714109 RepID=A0A841G5E9_9ACTN|nr:hypothetical protein [Phytomonospora endophytica]MBB6039989.1 hypothetical protein [Phytomonospora endophytica]GIG71537.1 hypothetical protein Pen01_78320 [Phytomonospora endophytica]
MIYRTRPKPAPSRGTAGNGHEYAKQVIPGGRKDGQTVFAGHGVYRGDGYFTVPQGTTIKFYGPHGKGLSQSKGLKVERGSWRSPIEVYGPGDRIPDYVLKTPDRLKIMSGSQTVSDSTRLSDLLKPGMGTCHWAACRSYDMG